MRSDKRVAVMFPGQGSQFIGMGSGFFENDPESSAMMDMAEAVSGFPIRKLCAEGPLEELTRAVHLQPALTAVNLICWNALHKAGCRADYFVGHSLGEYSALAAAGVLSMQDALALVTERGKLMEREGQLHPGGMRAVLGLTFEEVAEVLDSFSGKGVVTAANHNSERQVVISGEIAALDEVGNTCTEKGGKVIPLPVSVANHSPLVADAVPDFKAVMAKVEFRSPVVPVYFNVTAGQEKDPDVIRDVMARQIASRVRWFEIINELVASDVGIFIEVGPKKVLSGLLKKILPKTSVCRTVQVEDPESLQKCLAVLAD